MHAFINVCAFVMYKYEMYAYVDINSYASVCICMFASSHVCM